MNNLISGERIQNLADICLLDQANPNYRKYCKKYLLIKNSKKRINEIKQSNVIYIPSHYLEFFFKHIYPHINKCILITHNSDHGIMQHQNDFVKNNIKKALDDNKIIKWFGQNISYNHSKLESIPIGIANSMYKHGNLNLLNKIMINPKIKKTNLYLFNFNIGTNPKVRQEVYNTCIKNKLIFTTKFKDQSEYFTKVKQSKFCICPDGNGIDTHRIWEALYLNSIPIISNIHIYNHYQELPILFIQDWNTLTEEMMNKVYNEFKNKKFDKSKINLDYYKKLVNNSKENI